MSDDSAWVPLTTPAGDGPAPGSLWWCIQGSRVAVTPDGRVPVGQAPADAGIEGDSEIETTFLGTLGGAECWAADIGRDVSLPDGYVLTDLRALHPLLGERRWALAGRAVQLVEWQRTHRYCGRCATPTEPAPGERARRCPTCGLLAFPRLAPAVITLVEREGEVLLAQGVNFGIPMYSCIAGFVEAGERLEEAVAREISEEVGVEVADIRYQGSQPWPFPHSLMIGFRATWASGDIRIDPSEIADAAWFRPDELPAIPPGVSIARTLINAWLTEQGVPLPR